MRALARAFVMVTATSALTVCVVVGLFNDGAWATPSVTISPANPSNQQSITVSGTGFPARSKDPTGMQILECADPGGSSSGLPTSNLLCDGATINPSQINTDANGSFAAKYTVYSLNGAHTSNIYCDRTHFCVLWVGVDYNNNFFGTHAFSTAFEIGGSESTGSTGSTGTGSGSGIAIWLPIVVVVAVGGSAVLVRARRRRATPSALVP